MGHGTRFAVKIAAICLLLASWPLALWYRGFRTRIYYDTLVRHGCRVETKYRCARWWPDWISKHVSNPAIRGELEWPFCDVAYVYANDNDVRWLPLIAGDTSIREVFFKECKFGKVDLTPLNTLPQLEAISFVGSDVSDESLLQLSGCSQLSRVNLNDTKISSKGIQAVRSWPQLRRISLQEVQLDDAGVQAFEATPLLEQLDLSYGNLRGDDLNALRKLSLLKWLDLSGNRQLHGKCLEDIGYCKNLVALYLPASALTDRDLAPLRNLVKLRDLHIHSQGLKGDGFASLSKLPELKELHLGALSDRGAEEISRILGLETLEISDSSSLTDSGLRHFAQLKNLKRLTLRKFKCSEQAWIQLRADLAPLAESDCHTWGKAGRTLMDPKSVCYYPEMSASDSESDPIFRRFP